MAKIPELHVNLLIVREIEHIYKPQSVIVSLRAVLFNNIRGIRIRNTCDAAFIRIV